MDRYLLQYRTALDDKVRPDHQALEGITLPPSDPFWDKYYPPNGWGCRCNVVQVRRGKYAESDPKLAMLKGDNATDTAKQQMFRFNPGKTMRLFPPKHPYYPKNCSGCAFNNGSTLASGNEKKDCQTCQKACKILCTETIMKKKQIKELTQWYKKNLPTVKVGKFEAQRFEVSIPDAQQTIYITRKFYNEVISKHKEDPLYSTALNYARKAHLLLPKAKKVNTEESKHHKDADFFSLQS